MDREYIFIQRIIYLRQCLSRFPAWKTFCGQVLGYEARAGISEPKYLQKESGGSPGTIFIPLEHSSSL